jgi:cytochrome c1
MTTFRRSPGPPTGRRSLLAGVLASGVLAAGLVAGCAQVSRVPPPEVPGGNPARGQQLIRTYGCGSCHTIAGVPGADGLVGPPLTGFGERSYIAGQLPNTGPNLQRWIRNPQAVEPGTAMPDLGVTARDARDIAAYLFSGR